nr:Os12g0155250 [Ipomoea trifida]
MTPASLALVVVWTLNPLVSYSSVEWQGCSSLARISCGGLWWPFSPDGSRLGVGYSSARKSSLSRNVFSISLFKKFITWTTYISAVNGDKTCVMFGANTTAMLCEFILFRCSSWTTSAIKLMAQSRRAASVAGNSLTSATQSSSESHCITCS